MAKFSWKQNSRGLWFCLNNRAIATIHTSGSWGYVVITMGKSFPSSLKKYYKKIETAKRNTEKYFLGKELENV